MCVSDCQVKAALSGSSFSDYLVFIRAVLGWRRVQQEGDREDREEYLVKHTLSRFSLQFINGWWNTHTHLSALIRFQIASSDLPHLFAEGLISQFSTNLHEAKLVSRASECQRQSSLYNEHSDQEELLKAVLLAGLYPNLIQVLYTASGSVIILLLYILLHRKLMPFLLWLSSQKLHAFAPCRH